MRPVLGACYGGSVVQPGGADESHSQDKKVFLYEAQNEAPAHYQEIHGHIDVPGPGSQCVKKCPVALEQDAEARGIAALSRPGQLCLIGLRVCAI